MYLENRLIVLAIPLHILVFLHPNPQNPISRNARKGVRIFYQIFCFVWRSLSWLRELILLICRLWETYSTARSTAKTRGHWRWTRLILTEFPSDHFRELVVRILLLSMLVSCSLYCRIQVWSPNCGSRHYTRRHTIILGLCSAGHTSSGKAERLRNNSV